MSNSSALPAKPSLVGRKPISNALLTKKSARSIANPYDAEAKWGDLKGIRVHDFSYGGAKYSIAYEVDHKAHLITILHIGPHENFYKRLKRYLFG